MSNLLDKASIILTPTAYNNGEALCVKPSDGSGDFDFSRNSAATRVNAQGLVENVQILSSNLVQNGDFSEEGVEEVSNGSFSQEGVQLVTNGSFDTDSDWAKGTGWSISGGSANCDGTQTSGTNLIQNGLALGTNKIFKIEFELKDYQAGELIYVNLTGTGILEFENINANGTYVAYSGLSTGDNFITFRADADFIGSIDNVSVREVGQDWNLIGTATITENQANIVTASAVTGISQSNILTIGKSYKLSYNIVSNNNGGLKISGNEIPSVVGNNTYYFEASAASLEILRNSGITDISITNISVKEVGQNWALVNATIGNDLVLLNADSANAQITQSNLGSTNLTAKLITFTTLSSSDEVSQILRISQNIAGSGVNIYTDDNGVNLSAIGVHKVTIPKDTSANDILFVRLNSGANRVVSLSNFSVIEITTDTSLPRINYEGFSYQDALGSEEVVNGDYEQSGIGNALSQSGGILVNENNQLKITSNGSSGFSRAVWNTNGLEGEQFLIKADIISVSGNTRFIDISNNQGQSLTQGTTFSTIITLGSAIKQVGFGGLSDTSFELVIDNVSVKEYLGQEVVPDSGCGSWLWEPQSTNLITQSEDFSGWSKFNSTYTANQGIAPDGSTTMDLITYSSVGGSLYKTMPTIIGTTYTLSLYMATQSGTIDINIGNINAGVYETKTVTTIPTRFSITQVASANNRLAAIESLGIYSVLVWGAQLEQQSYATSYIPTSGSTVTRNQDVCTNGGSLASINSTEGVLYAEIAALVDTDVSDRVISLSDNTITNRVELKLTATGSIQGRFDSATSDTTLTKIGISTTNTNKIALYWESGKCALWINGIKEQENLTFNTFASNALIDLSFNSAFSGGSSLFFGKTKALAVWKEALSDAELTELTTI